MCRKCSGKNIFSASRRVPVALPRITNAPSAWGQTWRDGCYRAAAVIAFRRVELLWRLVRVRGEGSDALSSAHQLTMLSTHHLVISKS